MHLRLYMSFRPTSCARHRNASAAASGDPLDDRLKNRDPEAMRKFHGRYASRVYSILPGIIWNAGIAGDVKQDVFLRISQTEIAGRAGWPLGTVKTRVRGAPIALRKSNGTRRDVQAQVSQDRGGLRPSQLPLPPRRNSRPTKMPVIVPAANAAVTKMSGLCLIP